jgi:lipopolysaccharide/colanic/teichoic acid biosynthesis glycosyltransferase
MSFVGPRPERPEFIDKLQEEIPFYQERHLVKPGLTGWAQINYPYGDSVEDALEKLRYDLYYIKNRSLMLDVSTVLKTVNTVLRGLGR